MMAEIENQVLDDREIGDANLVSAQIVYQSDRHEETIHHGCWLSEQFNQIEIPVNAVRYLILAVAPPGHGLLTVDNHNERWDRMGGYRQVDLERESYEIRITLRNGARNVLMTRFRLDYNADANNEEDTFNLMAVQ